jgi:tripeptide aminopeptidase
MTSVKDRFLKYVKIDTRSDMDSEATPSTQIQFDLAKVLVEELKVLGLQDISLDKNCVVMATLPANTDKKLPVIGFIAHMDTSPEVSGTGVNPRIVESYDGKDLLLNKGLNLHLDPKVFPELVKYVGQELIVTDGNTLLGADDKAGIAMIMAALEILVKNPSIKHGTVKVAFTPDEEVGRGADNFDVKKFGAEFAYTLDGGEVGEIEFETFNAAEAKVTVHGKSVHPGYAKNKMVNCIHVAEEFDAFLPYQQRPEYTAVYEGFYHLHAIKGDIEVTEMTYIIRDHSRELFEKRKETMQLAADAMNTRYGAGTVEIKFKDQYYNMREKIEPVFHIVELARDAIEQCGIKPIIVPVRGGTDGSRLSFMGLPCPNIFTGGLFAHGRYECVPTPSLEKGVDVLLKLLELSLQRY